VVFCIFLLKVKCQKKKKSKSTSSSPFSVWWASNFTKTLLQTSYSGISTALNSLLRTCDHPVHTMQEGLEPKEHILFIYTTWTLTALLKTCCTICFPPPPQNVMYFIMWSFLYHTIFTFYIQKCSKIWMPNPGF